MYKTLKDIAEGKPVEVPTYDFVTHSRLEPTLYSDKSRGEISPESEHSLCVFCRLEDRITVYPADVVLFEGILVFYPQKVREMFQMKLFVDTDSDVRLSRRGTRASISQTCIFSCEFKITSKNSTLLVVVLRDMNRGRDLEQILNQYTTFVKPAFEEFCLPVSTEITEDALGCIDFILKNLFVLCFRLKSMQMSSFQGG